ncbi:MAG: helix-turn-helix domain-containing protein [Chloroflexi bacterium]|nr:helix-turn-helix domain-containing protein [Chloroflexota bacterium]
MLQQARAARRISLNQAALETRIRSSVLEALERDDYAALPPRPFLRGLLRNYAQYLNLDAESVLDEYDVITGFKVASTPRIEIEPPSAPPITDAPLYEPFAPPQPARQEEVFPPFEIPTTTRDAGNQVNLPQGEPEPALFIASEIESQVPPPTVPLNIPQEPPTLAQKIGSTRIPEIIALIALAVALAGLLSAGFAQFDRLTNLFGNAPTPRPTATTLPTVPPGSTPTGIPTLPRTLEAATPLSFTGAQVTVTPAFTATPTTDLISPTLQIPADAKMTLTIQAEGQMEAWVLADGQEVFNAPLQNETHTWTAHTGMFLQVKNISRGRVAFNDKRILPRNQQERTNLVRAWLMNAQGTPVAVPPTPFPVTIAPTRPPTALPSLTPIPTNTPTALATHTRTITSTLTFTPTLTATRTSTTVGTTTATPAP